MTPQDLKKIAQEFGINQKGMSRTELIRSIQRQEGNYDCFATAVTGECDQDPCRWREDCLDVESAAQAPH